MKIGLFRARIIGDNIVAMEAIYAIKCLYPHCHLVVFTNQCGISLYSELDIDELVDIDGIQGDLVDCINQYRFDYFLLTWSNRPYCRMMAKTNAKQIITFFTAGSWFRPRFKCVMMTRNFTKVPQYARLLRLVRKIDKKKFDENIDKIDFSNISFTRLQIHKNRIDEFLQTLPKYKALVLINPFSRSTGANLLLEHYQILCSTLAKKYKDVAFVLTAYNGGVAA